MDLNRKNYCELIEYLKVTTEIENIEILEQEINEVYPKELDIYVELSNYYTRKNKIGKSIINLEKYKKNGGKNSDVLILLAKQCLQIDKEEQYFENFSDIELLETEQIYWNLLKSVSKKEILNIEIFLTKLYCFRKINFVNRLQFMDLIYNKITTSSQVVLKKFYNKILNLLEQRYNVVKIKSLPQNLSVVLTNKCNAKCKFCNFFKREWELPKDVYNEILKMLPVLIKISLLGGEVFLYKHFKTLFLKAKEYNVRQEIITNGMLLTEEWIDEFIKTNMNLAISIRSTEKKIYEYLTKGANFKKLVSNLEYLNKRFYKKNKNFNLSMFVLVTKYNYMELENIIDFAHKYNFELVRFIQLDNIKDSSKSYNICNQNNETYSKLLDVFNRATKLANKYGIKIKNELPLNMQTEDINKNKKIPYLKNNPYLYKTESYELDINEQVFNVDNIFCLWPWKDVQIDAGGDIFFSCFCIKDKSILGNVRNSSLIELWNSNQVINFREKIINNNYKDICNEMCLEDNVHRKDII